MENYIVSARKYRPDTFESVVAQKALTTTLKNAIHSGKLAHAYLFCGPRGVGKTTCARIFAKTINCEHPTANGEPCNECESCMSFNQQRSYSIYELDAASNNSVDDIRSLNEQVRIPPQIGRYKVYIIDEVHMLSQAAFNAFLKTLEEPPAHAIFILATTEKHKIIPTILSRCQIYDFGRIETADIVSHLQNIAQKENINSEHEALRIIAQKSDGCMRDALSLFDQMVSFTQGDLTYSKVIESLNVLDYEYYFRLTNYILAGEIAQALLLLNDVLVRGFEGNIFIEGAAAHFRDLLVSSDPATVPLFEGSQELCRQYSEQASKCTARMLYKAIKLCNDCSMNYRASRNKRLLVELTIIQLAQLTSDEADDASGLGPKQLKPIFNKPQSNDSAVAVPQPAHTSSKAPQAQEPKSNEKPVAEKSNPTAQAPTPTVMQGRPEGLRTTQQTSSRTLGGMFSATMKKQSKEQSSTPQATTPDTAPTVEASNTKQVTTELLIQAWTAFAMQLPENERALSDRMKIITPTLHPDNEFSIAVDNQLVADMFEKESKRIIDGIAHEIGGARLRMKIIVNKVVVERHVYDRTKQYEILKNKNPLVEKLREQLNLELS
ncbi:MAG: DNA polymerase III subunit gamma/tau [Bacteroidaceae bacterium]|nr:DNA polymerase III subunit gamma/tau [Bacteroidaceae bacterium]